MTKTLTVVTLLLTIIVPVSARANTAHHHRSDQLDRFRGAYNQFDIPYSERQLNIQNFGFGGRDPSRVGGWDPSLHPSGS
jgi:hypothetical protein